MGERAIETEAENRRPSERTGSTDKADSPSTHWSRSIVTKQTVFVMLVVLVISQILGVVGFVFARQMIVERVRDHLASVAEERRSRLLSFVRQQHERVKLVASRTRFRQLVADYQAGEVDEESFRSQTRRILNDARSSLDEFQQIWFADSTGKLIASADEQLPDRNFVGDEAFEEGRKSAYLAIPTKSKDGSYSALLTCPADSRDGKPLGVMIVKADMSGLTELLRDRTGIGESGEVLVGSFDSAQADEKTIRYLLPPRDFDAAAAADAVPSMKAAIEAPGDEVGHSDEEVFAGKSVLIHYLPVNYHNRGLRAWGLVAKMDVAEAYQPLSRLARFLALLQLVFLALVGAISYLLVRRLLRPIRRLADAAHAVADGDLQVELHISSRDEVGELTESFNRMTAELRGSYATLEGRVADRTQELRQRNHELQLTQNALVVAKDAAESANRAKGEFLATMSHEIRTPMNAVIGMTDLVLDTELTDVQREYLVLVKDSADSLLALINDILDFSKIEAGKLELDHSPFVIRETLGDLMKVMATRARGRDLELICRIAPDVPRVLVGDALRLRQIATNLLGNALKFTERGEIQLDVTLHESMDRSAVLQISVRDTGIGIADEKREAIFTAFSQADASTTRRFGGTGLGLAITSRLVEMMGGSIELETQVGFGSTFLFHAKFDIGDEADAPRRDNPEVLEGLHVLVVDDNNTNRMVLVEMLSNWGMVVTALPDAEQAFAELKGAGHRGEPYRAVLTDAHMPSVDGFEFMHRMQLDDEVTSPVVLMLSSGASAGDIERCKSLGGAGHLVKPVRQSDLFDALIAAVNARVTYDAKRVEPEEAVPNSVRRLKVLVAEDSLPNQRLMLGVLKKWGHEITVANNGQEALRRFQEEGPFDVVFMDVQMPLMDGYESTQAIRQHESASGRRTPIVAVTAHAMKGDRERCLDAGMDDYVSKPIRNAELQRIFREWFPNEEESVESDDSVATSTAGADVVLNWNDALEAVGGDADLLQEVLVAVVDECGTCLAAIEQAVSAADSAALARAAHTFRGSLRMFGDTPASEIAGRIEALAKVEDFAAAERLSPELSLEAQKILRAIRKSSFANPSAD